MTDLFPIGSMTANSNIGKIDNVNYYMFEPNKSCQSKPVYNNYSTLFQQQTMLTRKKSLPTLSLSYTYNDIFSTEYNQIEHFIDNVEDNLTSFYVIDFSKGIKPTAITTDFDFTLSNTRLFSSVANQKAHYVFFWNGVSWKFGEVTSVTANTSVTTDVTGANYTTKYGAMTPTIVSAGNVYVYPIYECYTIAPALEGFSSSQYIQDTTKYGFIYNGSINFHSKYKV